MPDSIKLIKSYVQDSSCEDFYGCYCPVCGKYFSISEYLSRKFGNDESLCWLANMITHYRHVHTNWDKNKYKLNGNKGIYEKDKAAVNEYIKQVVIRKYSGFLKEHGINEKHFAVLLNTNNQTLKLAGKLLCQ